MAIIITRKDCTLSEANAFYRIEASNMSLVGVLTGIAYVTLAAARYINLTFANAGNFTGAGFVVYATATGDRSLTCELQHGQTATLAIASPGVVGLVSHGFAVGTAVQFTTVGTLPTTVVANTVYYARNTDCVTPANEFWLYGTQAQAIAGGATGRINFTGSSSGTHTCWVVRSTQTKTWETIRGGFTSPIFTGYDKLGVYIPNFNAFDVAYAVTTAANTWRLRIYQSGGTTGTLNLWYGADIVNFSYWVYCDTQVSFTNGDTPIFAHYCEIDQTANFNGVLGTGDTVRGTAGVICSNESALDVYNVSFLKCTAPAASYTLTLNGLVYVAGHSGMMVGTAASPISAANQFILNTGAPTVGTVRGGIAGVISASSANYYYNSRSTVMFYGAHPAKLRTALTADVTLTGLEGLTCTMTVANPCVVTRASHGFVGNEPVIFTTTGALPNGGTTTILPNTTYYVKYVNASTFRLSTTPGGADLSTAGGSQSGTHYFGAASVLPVTEDMSLQGWGNGDIIMVGKQNVQGVGNTTTLTIASITGTNITLTHVLPQYSRLSGGSVINLTPSKYGVNLIDTGTNTAGVINLMAPNNFNMEGCYIKGVYYTGAPVRYYDDDADANVQQNTFKDSVCMNNGSAAASYYAVYNVRIPRKGFLFENVWGFGCIPMYSSFLGYAIPSYKSGTYTINGVGVLSRQNYSMGIIAKTLCDFKDIYIENGVTSATSALALNLGAGSVVDGVYIYGDSCAAADTIAAIAITAVSINSVIKNVYITNCRVGILISGVAVSFGITWNNIIMSGNTVYDLVVSPGAYITTVFKDCSVFTLRNYTNLTDTTDGTSLAFVNYGGTPYLDSNETTWGIFTRTGGALPDSTTHTVGATKYAIRFENTLQGTPLQWKFNVPTGNILGQTLIMGVWVKINSANYYSVNYNKPRMTINYDNGASSVYVEATNTTSWQYLSLPVTPATDFGQIEVIISADTDQTGTDAYVYFDDMSVFYPAGVALSLGGLDLWSSGLPIVPPIATGVNANDVWAALESGQTVPNSMGMAVKRIDVTTKNNQGLILKG